MNMLASPLAGELPVLETPRLLLRMLRLDDAADMYEYACDLEIAHNGLWLPFETLQDSIDDIEETLEGYRRHELLDWAVQHKADRKMIGRLGLHSHHPRDRRAEIGYAYNRHYYGQGIATEAARAVLEFGFTTLQLNRIGARALPDNAASIRVLVKLGMQFEGVQREYTTLRGKPEDLHCYSILRREWQAHPTTA